MIKNAKYIVLTLAALYFGLATTTVFAQNTIINVKIDPLNRATFYFQQAPGDYQASLSDDKKKIQISIPNATVADSARRTYGKGVVEDVYIKTVEGGLLASVILNDKRGYTAAVLPYSRSLIIDAVRWDKVEPDEDQFRTGLLALENNIDTVAEEYFTQAANAGNANSQAFLGLTHLKRGEKLKAAKNLIASIRNSTNIPDAFAALAQIAYEEGFKSESEFLAARFSEKTSLSKYEEIPIPQTPIDTTNPDTLKKYFAAQFAKDPETWGGKAKEVFPKEEKSSPAIDSVAAQYTTKDLLWSFIPADFGTILTYSILIGLVIILFVISRYLKWRKKQMEKLKEEKPDKAPFSPTSSLSKEVADSFIPSPAPIQGPPPKRKAPQNAAAKKYSEQSEIDAGKNHEIKNEPVSPEDAAEKTATDEKNKFIEAETKEAKSESKENEAPREPEEKVKSSEKIIPDRKTETIDKEKKAKTIDNILLNIRERKIRDAPEKNASDNDNRRDAPINAKLELALHLQREQQKLKNRSLDELERDKTQFDLDKLTEVAKRLGVEKGALETRKKVEELQSNKESLSKLSSKFKKNSDIKQEKD